MKERSLESFGRNECVCLGEGGGRWRAEGRGEMNEKNVVRLKMNELITIHFGDSFISFIHS